MNEKLSIDLVVNTDKAERQTKQALNNMANSASGTTKATSETTANVNEMADALRAIRQLNVFQVLTNALSILTEKMKDVQDAWQRVKRDFGDIGSDFREVGVAIKDLASRKNFGSLGEKINFYKKEIRDLPELLKPFGSSLKTLFSSTGSLIKTVLSSIYVKLLAIIVAIKAIVGLVRMINEITQIGAEIDDMSQKIQTTTAKYQQWSYIMQMCGSNMNELQTAMNGMIQRLKSVDQGSEEAIAGFQKLGISVYDTTGNLRDNFDLFEEAVEKLQQMEEGTERAVIAQQIFGRSASNLTILLNTSNEQMKNIVRTQEVLGLSMSENAIRMSAVYQDAVDTMKQAGQSLKSVVMELFVQPFLNIVKGIIKAITYVKVFIQTIFGLKSSPVEKDNTVSNIGEQAQNSQKNVEKLQRSLMGFDELNVVSKGETSTGIETDLGDFGLNDTKSVFDSLFSEEELTKIDNFKKKIAEFGENLKNNPIVKGVITIGKKLFDALKDIWDRIKDDCGEALNSIWNLIVEIWNGIYPLIELAVDLAVGLIVPAIEGVMIAVNAIIDIVSGVISTVFNLLTDIWNFLEGFFKYLWGLLTGDTELMIEGIEQALEGFNAFWSDLWEGIKTVLKGAWDFIGGIISKIAEAIGNVVDAISEFFGIDKNTRANIGYSFTGGYVHQTAMATGGIVSRPVSALIGEAGREAVLPLDNNVGWMDALADRVVAKQNVPSKIVLKVGETELGWASIKGINQVTEQTGQVQLVV